MPFAQLDRYRAHYALDGPAGAPCLVFSNSLGTDLSMWEPQVAALAHQHRVLRYDSRGHGRSEVTPGPYRIEQLGRDVLALLDHLGIERADYCGLSMGGMVGMWLALNGGRRLGRIALCNTGAQIGSPELWNGRIDKVTSEGMAAIGDAVLDRWFTPEFARREPAAIDAIRTVLERTSPDGYAASCAAIRDSDLRDEIAGIDTPTLVVVATHDKATPPDKGRFVAQRIPGARLVELDAAHISNIEAAPSFTAALIAFLEA